MFYSPCGSELASVASDVMIWRSMPPKKITDIFPPVKRVKLTSGTIATSCIPSASKFEEIAKNPTSKPIADSQFSSTEAELKWRIELNRLRAQSKRNLKICLNIVAEAKAKGLTHVNLEKLLVEKTWLDVLPGELQKPYAKSLCQFVEKEIKSGLSIYPPHHLIFNALNSTPFDAVKVVIIGQDPYHGIDQAMGLSFSVPDGVGVPSSLLNIFKELKDDVGCSIPPHGNLERWAIQGVLLLNAVLTVRSHQANSHAKKGWEQFTDTVIKTISQKKKGVVFLLWGNSAQAKSNLIDEANHHILKAAHPSGLSANRGFFGCRHFSRTNKLLEQMGNTPIDWQL